MPNPTEQIGLIQRKSKQCKTKFWESVSFKVSTFDSKETTTFLVTVICNKSIQLFQFDGLQSDYETGIMQGLCDATAKWTTQLETLRPEIFSLSLLSLSNGTPFDLSAIAHYPCLRSLMLGVPLRDNDLKTLTQVIPSVPELLHLNITTEPKNFARATELAQVLRDTRSLERLTFNSQLKTNVDDVRKFGAILASIPYLFEVEIGGYTATDKSQHGTLLIELLRSPSIRTLISDVYFSGIDACNEAAEAMGSNSTLVNLTLRNDILSANPFARQLARNNTLERLTFYYNRIEFNDEFARQSLAEIAHCNPSLIWLADGTTTCHKEVAPALDRNHYNSSQRSLTLVSVLKNKLFLVPFGVKRLGF